MDLFNRILVPVDGSRHALSAVRMAARLCRIHGSDIRMIHVIDDTLIDQLTRFSRKNRETVREGLRRDAQTFLNDMRGEVHEKDIAGSAWIIREGVPHEVIVEEALAWKADLIVMGKLGRRGISHILLGSVAERVIDFSEVPVLVVKWVNPKGTHGTMPSGPGNSI